MEISNYSTNTIVTALSAYEKARARAAEYQAKAQEESNEDPYHHGTYWSTDEEDFIQNNPDMTTLDLALSLGRTYFAVKARKGLLKKVLRIAA